MPSHLMGKKKAKQKEKKSKPKIESNQVNKNQIKNKPKLFPHFSLPLLLPVRHPPPSSFASSVSASPRRLRSPALGLCYHPAAPPEPAASTVAPAGVQRRHRLPSPVRPPLPPLFSLF